MDSAAKRLQDALSRVDRQPFVAVAKSVGMEAQEVGQAFKGNPVSALAYMRLCALCGIDAATGARTDATPYPQAISWHRFGTDLRAWCVVQDLTIRQVTDRANVSKSTLSTAGQGRPVNTESFLAICALIGRRPEAFLSFVRADVRRETVTRTNGQECQPEARQ